jgi:hypothetical protein
MWQASSGQESPTAGSGPFCRSSSDRIEPGQKVQIADYGVPAWLESPVLLRTTRLGCDGYRVRLTMSSKYAMVVGSLSSTPISSLSPVSVRHAR